MKYRQLTSGERYELSALRKQGSCDAAIARALGRHRSTIGREVRRNSKPDGGYRANVADEKTRGRRRRSRQHWRFSETHWALVIQLLQEDWSPEQVSGRLRRLGLMSISHETIYRFVWDDRARGGRLYDHSATRTVRTVTVDHGTEFDGYKQIEKHTGLRFFFATPYHSWERGSSENTNGLIRQYFPKRKSMKHVTRADCDRVAAQLNRRPRK